MNSGDGKNNQSDSEIEETPVKCRNEVLLAQIHAKNKRSMPNDGTI